MLVPALAMAAPLSLAEAIATALLHNPTVRTAVQNAHAVEARIGSTTSSWLPQLNAVSLVRGDYNYLTGAADSAGSGSMRYTGQLQLNQLLYDFGRTGGRIAAAQAGAQAAVGDADTAKAQTALQALSSFFAVLQAEALRDVNQRNIEQQTQRLQQAESFFHIGTRPEIDVLIAKTAVKSAELQLVQAQNNILVARAQLLENLGLEGNDWPLWLQRPLLPPEPNPLDIETPELLSAPEQAVEALLEAALKRRPEYRAQRARVQVEAEQLRTARADYFPLLTLSGSANLNGTILNSSSSGPTISTVGSSATVLPSSSGNYPTLGVSGLLTLSWPLFSGLNTVYTVRDSQAQLAAAEATLDALRLNLRSQLLIAIYQVATARRSLVAAQALAEQADKQLQMARGRYRAGVGNAIELGDAEVAALTAQAQRVQADSALGLARATLRWHLGMLLKQS